MSLLLPDDRDLLAAAVADGIVVACDPFAVAANRSYHERARPWLEQVLAAARDCPDDAVRAAAGRLIAEPADAARYFGLRAVLAAADVTAADTAELFAAGWAAAARTRVGYHVGAAHDPDAAPITAAELSALPPGDRLPPDAAPEILVVIAFQDRDGDAGHPRLRNLLACLHALRDQSVPRAAYRVTVVESDDRPRWRDTITPLADHYLHAPKAGSFNKSWALNVGVVHSPGKPELLCLLDADCLVDRDYLARNVARFHRPGSGAHLTYRTLTSLDPAASAAAIRDRVLGRAADADPGRLRGILLHRTPGGSVWTRAEVFHRIGGLDERYEGWGGEDNDFFFRLDLATPLAVYEDRLLHLHHPPAAPLYSGGVKVNSRVPWATWRPAGPIGEPDRFRDDGSQWQEGR